jgi:ankyrin repeat protein
MKKVAIARWSKGKPHKCHHCVGLKVCIFTLFLFLIFKVSCRWSPQESCYRCRHLKLACVPNHIDRTTKDLRRLLWSFKSEKSIFTRDLGPRLLLWAAKWGHIHFISPLLQMGVDIDCQDVGGRTSLFLAIEYSRIPIVQAMLEANASTSIRNKRGWTPLLFAARFGCEPSISMLVGARAELDATTPEIPWTPLNLAVLNHHWGAAKLLLDAGADPNVRNILGFTSLHYAVSKCASIIQVFWAKKGDLNAKNYEGRSPLHLAAQVGNANAVKELIELGANPTVRDNDGKTPLDIAVDGNKGEAASVLSEAMLALQCYETR